MDTPPFEEERLLVFTNGGVVHSLAPQPFAMKGDICAQNDTSAFTVNVNPHRSGLTFSQVSQLYELPHFLQTFATFWDSDGAGGLATQIGLERSFWLRIWENFRIQVRTQQDTNVLLAPHTVQAVPPKGGFLDRCDTVLVEQGSILPFVDTSYAIQGGCTNLRPPPPEFVSLSTHRTHCVPSASSIPMFHGEKSATLTSGTHALVCGDL